MNYLRKKNIQKISGHLVAILFLGLLSECGNKTQEQTKDSNDKAVKELVVKEIQHTSPVDIEQAEKLLESNAKLQNIGTMNWSEYAYKPEVNFRIAYWQDEIWLKYYVKEENILAKETKINGGVHKDSCVEFFIAPGKEEYYNFEFNCVGVPHVQYGKVRENRVEIDPEILKLIKVKSSLGDQPFNEKTGGHEWEMMIVIPKASFSHSNNLTFKGLQGSANFYKCGDDTSKPHFVTWNPVGTEKPDYHQPTYFGNISFE